MNDTEKRYLWLINHLVWNSSRKKGAVYWVKITKEDADLFKRKYEVCYTRTLKSGIIVDVIKMDDNFIVLDTSEPVIKY